MIASIRPSRHYHNHNRSRIVPAVLCLLLATLNAQNSLAVETFTPEQELATFQLAEGFEANLFAAEDMGVLNPMQMRWDSQGRLFVISTLGYPQLKPGEEPNDKIIMLEDTDNDGRADKSTVFAEDLNIPTGLEPGYGGLYVGEQTNLIFLKDTDGDGKADHREVVLSGFGVGDTHQAINSFVWSPGGELYFDQGDGIESRVETPWGLSGLYQAGVLRLRPKRLQLDPILDDFMGPGNPWGIAFDDWGQTFVVDGAGGITFLSPAMMPVHHRKRLRTIGDPGGYCGIEFLGSKHLPADYQGDFLLGDFQRNRIKRFAAKPNGSGFEVVWKDPLLVAKHRNFRPVDVRTGPDGAIYICDWYNSVICHQDDPFRHPDRDFAHGRIWRITNKNAQPIQRPALHNASIANLLKYLESPERWTRYHAKTELAEHDRRAVKDAVVSYWSHASKPNPSLLFELIGVLESVEAPNQSMLEQLLAAKDHRARAYAARVIGRWHDRMNNPLALLESCVRDEHPQVRMEAIVACAHLPSPHAAEVAAIASDFDVDYDIDYALTQTLHHLKDYWIPSFQRGELSFGGEPNRMAAVLQRVNSSELLSTLRRMASSGDLEQSIQLAILKTLARVGDAHDLNMVLDAAATNPAISADLLAELLSAHRSRLITPEGDLGRLEHFIVSNDASSQAKAISLAGVWKVAALLDHVLAAARDNQAAADTRHAALISLGKIGGRESKETLSQLATDGDVAGRVTAVASLSQLDVESAARFLSQLLGSEESIREEHFDQLVRAFASRKEGFRTLARHLSQQQLDESVATRFLNALNAFGPSDERLTWLLSNSANRTSNLPEHSDQLVSELVALIPTGDPHRGAKIFRSKQANCSACHQINSIGGTTGPDLSGVGTTLPKDRLVQEVLWPRRLVKEGYTLRQIITEDGEVLQGYVRKSRDKKVVLLRPLDSETLIRVPEDTIEHQQDVGSAMPENVVATLTSDQRIDLLAFLSQLGTPDGFTGVEAGGESK